VRQLLVAVAFVLAGGCASGPRFHEGPTALGATERALLLAAAPKRDGGVTRFWRKAGVRTGLIKWAAGTSRAPSGAPPEMLQAVRDELGRLNQTSRAGETTYVTVTVFRWERGFWSHVPEAGCEIAGRDGAGRALWIGEDTVRADPELAKTLADGEELIVARELVRKLRKELGL
jgi:hypothetical protein